MMLGLQVHAPVVWSHASLIDPPTSQSHGVQPVSMSLSP